MTITKTSAIAYVGLIYWVVSFGQLNIEVSWYLPYPLLSIFTAGIIVDLVPVRSDRKLSKFPTSVFLLCLITAIMSSLIIGGQLHERCDGGPAFSPRAFTFYLGLLFPMFFGTFIWSVSHFNGLFLRCILILLWAGITCAYGYGSDDCYDVVTSAAGDLEYFKSFAAGPKLITPMIVATIVIVTIWTYFQERRTFSEQSGSSQTPVP